MKLSRFRSLVSLVCFCQLFGNVLMAEVSSVYRPVKLRSPLEVSIPQDLKHLGISRPEVKFRVIVDGEGAITDYLAVEATHFGLLEPAEKKLAVARFEPATLDGEATVGKITITVTFFDPEQRAWKQGGIAAPHGGSVSDAVERRLYSANPDALRYAESEPSLLDEPLKLLESKIYRLHAPEKNAPVGSVLVEYYIDAKGRVRLPEILETDDDTLSMSVLMSLQSTRFRPPTVEGRPTYVRVRQPFNFNAPSGEP